MQQWRNDYADITLRNGERFTLLIYGEPHNQPGVKSGIADESDHERFLIETGVNPIFSGVYAKDDERAGEVMGPMLECLTLEDPDSPELAQTAIIRRDDISSITLRMAIEETYGEGVK